MEKGEYIRTQKGKIGKVANVWKSLASCRNETRYLIDWGNGKAHYIAKIKDLKHSKNIIDLIEVGDYVNGEKICSKYEDELYACCEPYEDNLVTYRNEDIKTIVTKEKFKEVSYEL